VREKNCFYLEARIRKLNNPTQEKIWVVKSQEKNKVQNFWLSRNFFVDFFFCPLLPHFPSTQFNLRLFLASLNNFIFLKYNNKKLWVNLP
jgi:hypothetical protein